MIEFQPPLLIPLIYITALMAVGIGLGACWMEMLLGDSNGEGLRGFRWFLLIVPSLVVIFLILWWPGTYAVGGG